MKANKRDRIVKVRLTNLEYEELTKASKSSKCMSDYFRQRVFRKGVGLIDPKEFIRSMDEICLEMTVLFRVLPGMDDKRTLL